MAIINIENCLLRTFCMRFDFLNISENFLLYFIYFLQLYCIYVLIFFTNVDIYLFNILFDVNTPCLTHSTVINVLRIASKAFPHLFLKHGSILICRKES